MSINEENIIEINTEISCEPTIYSLKTNDVNNIPEEIKFIENKEIDFLFLDLHNKMCELKSNIEDKNIKLWDVAKKKVNPYELVNIIGTNVLKNENFKLKNDNYIPLSRAFFKLTEIMSVADIIPDNYKDTNGVIANIAEGPGGFIEAIYKKRIDIKDKYYATTLYSNNKNIPGWKQILKKKNHFLNNENISLKTGNLYNINTILHYSFLFKKKKAFLVTCDGGFDNSNDFNNQEINSRKIIYAEIITTLLIQEKGGNMICKMFDIFTYFSIQLIYILTLFYEKVNIVKPVTSRPANSEKYIIAINFKGDENLTHQFVKSMLKELYNPDINNTNLIINNLNLPEDFIKDIQNINIEITNNQTKYILKTLEYINNYNKLSYDKNYHLKYSNLWFNRYNILPKNKLFYK